MLMIWSIWLMMEVRREVVKRSCLLILSIASLARYNLCRRVSNVSNFKLSSNAVGGFSSIYGKRCLGTGILFILLGIIIEIFFRL